MALTFLLACSASTPAIPQDEEVAARQVELEQVRERIEALRERMAQDLARRDSARDALREAEESVARQSRELRQVERRLSGSRSRLDALERDRERHEARLDAEREALAAQVRAAHALGREERLKLLLNQQDPAVVGRVLAYYEFLNRARIERIERVAELVAGLEAVKRDIVAETEALEAARDEQRALLARLERTRARRGEVLDGIERALHTQDERLERLQEDERSLTRLLQSLTDLLADVPPELGDRPAFPDLRGRLGWPVDGQLAARFGQARAGGGSRWRGFLVRAEAGAPVRAVAYGRVAFAGWMPHFGNLVVLEHGDDYYTLYAHNRTLTREAGEWVDAGDVIAQVGDSGGQAQPGLYFELRRGRDPQDPQAWLVRR